MSARFGNLPNSAGAHYGLTGLGVLGSAALAATASGEHGPGILANDIAPADAGSEYWIEVLTRPAAGALTLRENGAFEFSGAPAGSYAWSYRLHRDGQPVGTAAVTMTLT